MKLFDHFRCVRIAPLAILIGSIFLAVTAQSALGGFYSWTGTLERRNEANDPWGLGDVVTPFFMSVAVLDDARDGRGDIGDDLDLTLAAFSGFDLTDPQFRIDGEAAIVREDNRIFFFDGDSTDTIDLTFHDVFFRGGSATIRSVARIPGSTFTFDEDFESPPAFATVNTKFPSLTIFEGPYRVVVAAGVTATGTPVPEPSTFVLVLVAMLSAAGILRRNRSR